MRQLRYLFRLFGVVRSTKNIKFTYICWQTFSRKVGKEATIRGIISQDNLSWGHLNNQYAVHKLLSLEQYYPTTVLSQTTSSSFDEILDCSKLSSFRKWTLWESEANFLSA